MIKTVKELASSPISYRITEFAAVFEIYYLQTVCLHDHMCKASKLGKEKTFMQGMLSVINGSVLPCKALLHAPVWR
jgi:hypothetical protein